MTKKSSAVYLFMRHQLTGEQAYMAVMMLESLVHALWRTHGDDMVNFQGRVFPDDPQPYEAMYCAEVAKKRGRDDIF